MSISTLVKHFVETNTKISHALERRYPKFYSERSYVDLINNKIKSAIDLSGVRIILEAGGIDRPLLKKSDKYYYIGLDIEHRLGCDSIYDQFLVQSIEKPISIQADMILSFTLMEHVPDNNSAVSVMFNALRRGGCCHHYIPSKWHPYSIILRIIGPSFQKKLISVLRPNASSETGYPVFFNYCSPTQMRELFTKHGFVNIEITEFYRASDYFAFFVPAHITSVLFENICRVLNLHNFCSGFVISATKPLIETSLK
jgi:SAM-dependent methyltransferase